MRPERHRQNEFLETETLAQTTRLAITDLESQCVGRSRTLKAVMAHWIDVRAAGDEGTTYKVCGVCLGGASLVTREWLDLENQRLLENIYEQGTDSVMMMLPQELTDRMTAMDLIRELQITDAMRAFSRKEYAAGEWQQLTETCGRLETALKTASAAGRQHAAKRRETGTNHLWKEDKLPQRDLIESIRFFRKVVIPGLAEAGI